MATTSNATVTELVGRRFVLKVLIVMVFTLERADSDWADALFEMVIYLLKLLLC